MMLIGGDNPSFISKINLVIPFDFKELVVEHVGLLRRFPARLSDMTEPGSSPITPFSPLMVIV